MVNTVESRKKNAMPIISGKNLREQSWTWRECGAGWSWMSWWRRRDRRRTACPGGPESSILCCTPPWTTRWWRRWSRCSRREGQGEEEEGLLEWPAKLRPQSRNQPKSWLFLNLSMNFFQKKLNMYWMQHVLIHRWAINFTDMLKRLVYSRVLGGAVNVRSNIRTMASEVKENRLRTQLSPYLLQHKETK